MAQYGGGDKSIGAAIFVKTPGLSSLKTRLAQTIGRESAEEFHRRSAQAMEAVVKKLQSLVPGFSPYWAVAEAQALGHKMWSGLPCLYQGEGNLGQRLARIFEQLWDQHEQVVFLGNDSPQVPLAQWQSALTKGSHHPFYLGLTEDGGFYFFSSRKWVSAQLWQSVGYSQQSTAQELMGQLSHIDQVAGGLAAYDVDEGNDFIKLTQEVETTLLPEQRELIVWSRQQLAQMDQPGGHSN